MKATISYGTTCALPGGYVVNVSSAHAEWTDQAVALLKAALAAAAPQPASGPGCKFSLVRQAGTRDREGGWSWLVVLDWTGCPEQDHEDREPAEHDPISEEQLNRVLRFIENETGISCAKEGCGGPGESYAREPWFQWFPSSNEDWSRGLLIVSQCGGRDI